MQKALRNFLLLILILGNLSCRQDPEPEIDYLNDGTPRLISIHFPGIKDSDIYIDQKTRLINIKVPSLLNQEMIPTITLTNNAEIWGGTKNLIERYSDGVAFLAADSVFLPLSKKGLALADRPAAVYYTICKASGSLELGSVTKPWDYELYNQDLDLLWIPFFNLYGNKIPQYFQLKNRETGEEFKKDKSMVKGAYDKVNSLGIDLSTMSTLVPGSYDLSITDVQGKIIKIPQPVNVAMGTAYISYSRIYFGFEVAAGGKLNLYGNNLFDGYISLSLTDDKGKTIKLNNILFERTGHNISVPIPAGLKPGQYIMKMFQEESWNEICYRVNVFADTKKVSFIGTIGDDAIPCNLMEAVNVPREVETFFTFTQIEKGTPRFKLVSNTDQNQRFYGRVKPHRGGAEPPTVTLPGNVKPGLYTGSLEVTDESGKVVAESLPFAQPIRVLE